MSLINWSEALAVGIEEIDSQHKRLIELLNRLHESMKSGAGNAIIRPVLSDLLEYTRFHFGTEEKYMQLHKYPGYLRHKIEHDELTKKAKALSDSCDEGKLTITVEVMNFLKEWLRNHILISDKKLISCKS